MNKQRWISRAALSAQTVLIAGSIGLALLPKAASAQGAQPVVLDVPAPELVGGPWLNTPNSAPLRLANRRGKVTIVEFWTFG
jgi:hypothetical protein